MHRIIRAVAFGLVGLAIAIAALWIVAPPARVDTEIAFDPALVPADVDGWLADRAAQVPGLAPEHAATVRWARGPGNRTDLAIVYLHGFSATHWETRPLPDRVAADLGANLFLTRLTGHGRDGEALAEADAGDWVEDLAEAMAVARRLGDRVVVVGTSTGGTLAALLAADPDLAPLREDLAGVVMISPNFRVRNAAARLLTWPGAPLWIPVLAGPERSFEPLNARHARHWTTEYPTVAAIPMQALVDHAAGLDYASADVPVLFHYDPADAVVDHAATEAVAAEWGGPATLDPVDLGPGNDPQRHVIAGDILSPAHTPEAIGRIAAWIGGL